MKPFFLSTIFEHFRYFDHFFSELECKRRILVNNLKSTAEYFLSGPLFLWEKLYFFKIYLPVETVEAKRRLIEAKSNQFEYSVNAILHSFCLPKSKVGSGFRATTNNQLSNSVMDSKWIQIFVKFNHMYLFSKLASVGMTWWTLELLKNAKELNV